MSLQDYLHALRARWILAVVAVLLALGAAGFITYQTTPLYASSIQLFVSTPGTSDAATAYQGDLFSQQRVTSYAELMAGEELAGRIVNSLDLDVPPSSVAGSITASVVPETVILQATVLDPSPDRAQEIAEAVGRQFPLLVADLETPPGQEVPTVKVTVVEAADLPGAPVSPSIPTNLALATVLGLLAGIGLIILLELLDNTVKRVADIEEIADTAVIGGVVFDSDIAKKPLVRQLRGQSRTAEAFRQIRTNLQFLSVDDPPRVLVVTSSTPGEGKTTTAISLAIVLSQSGQRVALVEGDLRRPRVTKYLNLVGGVGLTNVLAVSAPVEDVLQQVGNGRLHVLAAGPTPPNPSELLGSSHMRHLIKQLRDGYDYVVIDSSPLLPVTDGAVLAALSDGVLLVARHGATKREQLRQSSQMLRSVDARLLGVVLNMVPPKSATADSYGYGYGYAADKPAAAPLAKRPAKHEQPAEAELEQDRHSQHDTAPVPVVRVPGP